MKHIEVVLFVDDPVPAGFIDSVEDTIEDVMITKDTIKRLGSYYELLYDFGCMAVKYPIGDGVWRVAGYYYPKLKGNVRMCKLYTEKENIVKELLGDNYVHSSNFTKGK